MFYSGKELAEYCNFFKLTHAVVLYDSYEHIEEMNAHVNNTVLYGVKWMVDFDNQTLDIGKPLFKGVKLHSHRGYRPAKLYDWEAPGKCRPDSNELSYGLDYSDTKYLDKVLSKLPTGSLVYMHSQGTPDPKNRASPKHLFSLATRYCNLKFIMGHAGNYGGMGAAKPSYKEVPHELQKSASTYTNSVRGYATSLVAFDASVTYANNCHNLFLDTSCFTKEKALALAKTTKWAVGSDYPFGGNSGDGSKNFTAEDFKRRSFIWNYDVQRDRFASVLGEDVVGRSHDHAIDYIETPIEELARRFQQKMQST